MPEEGVERRILVDIRRGDIPSTGMRERLGGEESRGWREKEVGEGCEVEEMDWGGGGEGLFNRGLGGCLRSCFTSLC